MILRLFLSFLAPLAIGFFLLHIFLPFRREVSGQLLLKGSLAVGLGFGITSCIYFLCLLLLGPAIDWVIFSEAGILILLLFIFMYTGKARRLRAYDIALTKTSHDHELVRILSVGFYTTLFLAFTNFLYIAIRSPHGAWDAWGIWNFRARFIFRGGEYWKDAFSPLLAPLHHPDYPLLLPLSISRVWSFIGKETQVAPMVIAFLFTFATIGILYSALSILRSKSQGILASLFLLSIIIFIIHGTTQIADIPIGSFFLATIVLIFLQDRFQENNSLSIFAGAMAGLSGWTKNEGLLFLVSFFMARFLLTFLLHDRKMHLKQLKYFILGCMPFLTMILYFKLNFAPPNDVFAGGAAGEILRKFMNFERYVQILETLFLTIFNTFPHVLLMLIYPVFLGIKIYNTSKINIATALLVFAFMIFGYFGVYLLSPYDVNWHLKFSLHRLLLQLWPSVLFTYFMIVRTPEEALMSRHIETNSEIAVERK